MSVRDSAACIYLGPPHSQAFFSGNKDSTRRGSFICWCCAEWQWQTHRWERSAHFRQDALPRAMMKPRGKKKTVEIQIHICWYRTTEIRYSILATTKDTNMCLLNISRHLIDSYLLLFYLHRALKMPSEVNNNSWIKSKILGASVVA